MVSQKIIFLKFFSFQLMYGEWALPDQTSLAKPKDNKVLGYIVHRLFELVYPPPLPPPAPVFQEFPIKIGIVGKAFSGKSTIIQSMCQRKLFDDSPLIHNRLFCRLRVILFPPCYQFCSL